MNVWIHWQSLLATIVLPLKLYFAVSHTCKSNQSFRIPQIFLKKNISQPKNRRFGCYIPNKISNGSDIIDSWAVLFGQHLALIFSLIFLTIATQSIDVQRTANPCFNCTMSWFGFAYNHTFWYAFELMCNLLHQLYCKKTTQFFADSSDQKPFRTINP